MDFLQKYKMHSAVLLTIVFLAVARASHLPHYIKACRRDDPEINKCALESARNALPYIVKGDKEFKNPPLNPLNLLLIDVQSSENLNLKLKECVLSGLDDMSIENIKFDLKSRHCTVVVAAKYLNLVAQYEVNGQIMVLPISGHGPMNITCLDSVFNYSFDFNLVQRNGDEYVDVLDQKITYEIGQSYYHFDNLFNGNEVLGDEINKFLNENSKQVSKDLSSPVSQIITSVVTLIIKSFCDAVPYKELFP